MCSIICVCCVLKCSSMCSTQHPYILSALVYFLVFCVQQHPCAQCHIQNGNRRRKTRKIAFAKNDMYYGREIALTHTIENFVINGVVILLPENMEYRPHIFCFARHKLCERKTCSIELEKSIYNLVTLKSFKNSKHTVLYWMLCSVQSMKNNPHS